MSEYWTYVNNLTERSLTIPYLRFTGTCRISSVIVQFFFQYSSYLFLKVFWCQISLNSNEWFSRNRRISKKAFPHSIAIFQRTTHALHLTGFFR